MRTVSKRRGNSGDICDGATAQRINLSLAHCAGTVDLAYAEHGMFRQSHTQRSLRGSLYSGTSLGANSNNAGALVDAMRWAHHDSPRRLLLLLAPPTPPGWTEEEETHRSRLVFIFLFLPRSNRRPLHP